MPDSNPSVASPPPRWYRMPRNGVPFISVCWSVNLALLLGIVVWVLTDVRASVILESHGPRVWQLRGTFQIPAGDAINREIIWQVLRAAALASGLGVLWGLGFGAPRHRQIRSWLAVLALAASWLALLTSVPEVRWLGQRWRLARDVPKLQPVAAELREHWPTEDGASDRLGPFSLYTSGASTILTPLTSRPEQRGVAIRAIERSPAGALRFGVFDQGAEVWLEWHPQGSRPASYRGGLDTEWELEQSSALGDGWFATAYSLDPTNIPH